MHTHKKAAAENYNFRYSSGHEGARARPATPRHVIKGTHQRARATVDNMLSPKMEPLRIMLNLWNQKELVATEPRGVVEVWKRGVLQDEYDMDEIDTFYDEHKWLFPKVTAHLTGKTKGCGEDTDRVGVHILHYLYLRDKPFVLVERDTGFTEVNGIPHFFQTYWGETAWSVFLENAKDIYEYMCGQPDTNS